MSPLLRTLEAWTTQQDYVWFLAALAWLAVLFGVSRPFRSAPGEHWLFTLALGGLAGAALELALLVQSIRTPYTKFDFAFGLAQALGCAALWWPALERSGPRWRARAATLLLAATLAAARVPWPLPAGFALALFGLLGAWSAVRAVRAGIFCGDFDARERRWLLVGLGFCGLLPAIVSHGPLALLADEPRLLRDLTHFDLLAATLGTVAGGAMAYALWHRRLRSTSAHAGLGRSVTFLLAWLTAALALAIWSSRYARAAYEENLLRRATSAAGLFDPAVLRETLGPSLQVTGTELRYYPNGQPVTVATVPHLRDSPAAAILRAQIRQFQSANPDIRYTQVSVIRSGLLVNAIGEDKNPEKIGTCSVMRAATAEDVEHLAQQTNFLEGPLSTPWGSAFLAKAALIDPASGRALGWLVLTVHSARWLTSFTQARLQALALAGLGAGFWGLALAYRLRREVGIAAEQRALAAAEADRLKTTFLAKVSHELRTPIQSVLGYSELLARAPLGEPHRQWLEALHSHGGLMLRLVNDLLDLGALQTGAFRLRPTTVDLPTLAADCLAALRPQAETHGVQLRLEPARDLPAWVEADPMRLRQILLNLLANAVKFSPRAHVRLVLRRAGETIEFVVIDTGPGIPPAQRSQLFQPFTRLESASSTEGTGLGLALVSGLAAAMHGSVRYEDTPGGGATFIVAVPLREQSAPYTTESTNDELPAYRGLRVLVADDNTLVRELLTAFLRENGADVVAVGDGEAAVAACAATPPHAVILDIAMPRGDGFTTARAIRLLPPPAPWIVGLSAHAQPSHEAQARAAGMDRFLAKPVSLATLAEALRAAPGLSTRATAVQLDPTEQLFVQLRAQYRTETPPLLHELREALDQGDWPRVRERAHYLKNSADVLGARELQAACSALTHWAGEPQDRARGTRLFIAVETASHYPFPASPADN